MSDFYYQIWISAGKLFGVSKREREKERNRKNEREKEKKREKEKEKKRKRKRKREKEKEKKRKRKIEEIGRTNPLSLFPEEVCHSFG